MKPSIVNRFLREKGNSLPGSTEILRGEGKNHPKAMTENCEGAGKKCRNFEQIRGI
jgi:hypothetical protein